MVAVAVPSRPASAAAPRTRRSRGLLAVLALTAGCGGGGLTPDAAPDAPVDAAPPDAPAAPCPPDMALVGGVCMDRYEAPNVAGAPPLVMYTFLEAEAWCGARGRRLCFDDEWLAACAGPAGEAYPYGDTRDPGVCNDDATWRTYDQGLLNGWPARASDPAIGSLDALFAAARAVSPAGAAAADHVEALYQGTGGGERAGCARDGVFDLTGNVEEWTRRRDGGAAQFHGNLKGRYWAEPRTCQRNVLVHGDTFRFYEIGFRCCARPAATSPG
jgi:formylglycine-generating enzyme required for sulfatase activity